MTEEVLDTKEEAPESAPSAETQKPEAQNLIPQSRFNEVNDEKKALQVENDQLKADQKAEVDKRLAEKENYKELAEKRGEELAEANSKAALVDDYEETLRSLLESQIELIPEDRRGLIPAKMSTKDQLEYIAEHSSLLRKPEPFKIGAGERGGGQTKSVEITAEQHQTAADFGMSDEDYVKYLDKE